MKGLADSTHRAYQSAQRRYLKFCETENVRTVASTKTTLCKFASSLAREKLKHGTIKSYLSGIRFLHISEGEGDPFSKPMHRLGYTLRGIRRCEAEAGEKSRERLPISPAILRKIKGVWDPTADNPDSHVVGSMLPGFLLLLAGWRDDGPKRLRL